MKRDFKPGRLAGDVFRDLRDRRLLPVVILLVVLLVAIPQLLGSKDDVSYPAAEAGLLVKQPFETEPVVIASEPELRAYQERLDAFQARNPFHQKGAAKPPGGGGDAAGSAVATDGAATPTTSTNPGPVAGTTATDPSSITPTAPTSDPVPASDPVPVPVPEPTPTTPTDGSGSGSGSGDGGGGAKLISTRIEVRMGTIGDGRQIKDVRSLDFLPDPEHPVVEFLRGDYQLTKAYFVVSSGVVSTEGEGRCAPNPKSCQFLLLEVGESQSFEYEDGERYRLKLVEVTTSNR